MITRTRIAQAIILALYLLSVVLGVWAIDAFGIVSVGFGLAAPAAVYVVGVTLVLRDWAHEVAGRQPVFLAIIAGAALSALINPGLALASGVAFLVSESLDLVVYEQIRNRFNSVATGMAVSNAVSIPVDSLIFLGLAFGSLDFFLGQIVGKGIATVLAIGVLLAVGTIVAMIASRRDERDRLQAIEAERVRRASLSSQERLSEDMILRATGGKARSTEELAKYTGVLRP